jgi:hypothetical protein
VENGLVKALKFNVQRKKWPLALTARDGSLQNSLRSLFPICNFGREEEESNLTHNPVVRPIGAYPQSIKQMALRVAAGYVNHNLIVGNLAPLFFLASLRVSQQKTTSLG